MATTVFIIIAGLAAAYVGFATGWLRLAPPKTDGKRGNASGYVLECKVTHRRVLPKESSHGFAYRTLWLLVSLNALESHSLDLARGWIFGYGGLLWRLTGLRSSAYLHDSPSGGRGTRSIREKLLDLLDGEGLGRHQLGDAWMLTMPSFAGFEGINPLTVYYCYDAQASLFMVVLEVHNTFGERHVYLLDINKAEKVDVPADTPRLRWVIPKDFHVSPFNNRQGTYTITISEPCHPPLGADGRHLSDVSCPLPYVDIHLLSSSESSHVLTMTATLRATESRPLTTSALLRSLARQPLALVSSFARILYEAWILHYVKRLDVYIRPDPKPARQAWGEQDAIPTGMLPANLQSGRGVGWQRPSWFEQYARGLVEAFLQRRAEELDTRVTLVCGNPDEPDVVFSPKRTHNDTVDEKHLTIWYLSPLFFSTVYMAPSAKHALLLGYHTERIFIPSSQTLFSSVFASDATMDNSLEKSRPSTLQCMRSCMLPEELSGHDNAVPPTHSLDPPPTKPWKWLRSLTYISMFLVQSFVEKLLYRLTRARFVPGQEPWLRWHRALDVRKASGVSSQEDG
ncbi:uncharacterized protein C8Q71DRAFT_906676 [Rhodofomes roseus]|uniref:DUF1365-domain-containing protein n=1 Tax=Rhodofomes roseus TaxID=34475 RepID=A0ABQ8KJL8_9APHY|nr:uncharacterized protein C8Q71DRAFT_906676 [Rhodofomes roseus]KAH9837698.1 hypothetical protein C8Q71DRAFT_906676 [Rhodofomes roseus]